MSIRVGINGLGRVGRAYLRYAAQSDDLEVVAVNDVADAKTLRAAAAPGQHVRPVRQGRRAGRATAPGHRRAQGRRQRDPGTGRAALGVQDVDVVVECTGKFRTREAAAGHLRAGAKRVLISAPGKGVDATIVMGVNDEVYDASRTRSSRTPRARPTAWPRWSRCSTTPSGSSRLHDDGARLHRRPEHPRRPAQGRPRARVRRGQHHPDDHGCREGGRRGSA